MKRLLCLAMILAVSGGMTQTVGADIWKGSWTLTQNVISNANDFHLIVNVEQPAFVGLPINFEKDKFQTVTGPAVIGPSADFVVDWSTRPLLSPMAKRSRLVSHSKRTNRSLWTKRGGPLMERKCPAAMWRWEHSHL